MPSSQIQVSRSCISSLSICATAALTYFIVYASLGTYSTWQITIFLSALAWGVLNLLCLYPPIGTLLPRWVRLFLSKHVCFCDQYWADCLANAACSGLSVFDQACKE